MKKLFVILTNLFKETVRVFKLIIEIDSRLVFMYFFTAFIGAIAPVFASYFFKLTLDSILAQSSLQTDFSSVPFLIVFSLAMYFVMMLVDSVFYWGLNTAYFDYTLRNKIQMGMNYRFTKKMSELDLGHLESPEVQNLITKVQNNSSWQVADFVRMLNYLFRDFVGILTIIVVLLPISVWIPSVILLFAIPRVVLRYKHGNYVWSMFAGSAPDVKKLWYMTDLLCSRDSIIESRIFQSDKTLLKKLDKIQNNLFEINRKPIVKYTKVLFIMPILESIAAFCFVYLVLPKTFSGALSVGTFTFLISNLEQMRSLTSWGATHFGEFTQHSLFIGPYFELIDLPKLVKEKKNGKSFKEIKPVRIEFKNVSFSYVKGKKVLKNVSFVIEPGQSCALVGINGAGKSTIIKLICRFYDVDSGEILVNGVNIKDLKLSNWYKFLGTLFQNFVNYNFSIRENIMLGNSRVKDEKSMVDAAKKSGAYAFVSKFPKSYDQMLGRQFEEGVELSVGQWQKIAIARAFYEKAPILILDEPTSAIDAVSEYEIFQNLNKVYKGKSLILVSHRFSTVRNADKIIVLDGGEILEAGSHEELLNMNGKYAKMFNTQAMGYK